jgi:hypothetical protein
MGEKAFCGSNFPAFLRLISILPFSIAKTRILNRFNQRFPKKHEH